MASWITHTRVADMLIKRGLDVSERSFTVGNIAPDCNIENEDWTQFEPSREVTHWMSEKDKKLSADYDLYYRTYVLGRSHECHEEYAFMIGYFVHLITDVEFQRFIRDEERIKATFRRLKGNKKFADMLDDAPEDFDTIKRVYGRQRVFWDLDSQDFAYLERNPSASYNKVLKTVDEFPDYLDYLPEGAITRKIKLLVKDESLMHSYDDMIFFPREEFDAFVENTVNLILDRLNHYKTIRKELS